MCTKLRILYTISKSNSELTTRHSHQTTKTTALQSPPALKPNLRHNSGSNNCKSSAAEHVILNKENNSLRKSNSLHIFNNAAIILLTLFKPTKI